ncbi:hypothetical protein Avbf_16171 [Armadillidium vulgare]|nr:hypothetical protein Avbf_16171 [Armadillidium vulgare]
MSILIARDITTKLYNMNHKIVTEKGPDVHRSPLRHATLARRSTTQFSPKLIRNLGTSTAGGKYLSYSSPPVSRYPSRMTMGCSLPASYKSENELLEEDEKGENEFLLTEHEGMIGKIV